MSGRRAALRPHRNPTTSEARLQDQHTFERRWWTLLVLCLSLLMVIVGNTVLNVALPTLVRQLGATNTQLQWIVDAYSIVFAGLLLTSGSLGDRYGRKGALTVGLFVFGTGSFLASVSNSPDQLTACRALMGAGASLVMPATLSILTNVFPPQERARAIAIWAGVAGAGGAIGPITSGWLLEHFWWGSVFLVNLPVVAIALIAGRVLVPTSRDPEHAPLDPVGAGLSIAAMGSLLYGIIEAPVRGWTDGVILTSFAAGLVLFAAFAAWELRTSAPMLDLRYFRKRSFSGGSLAIMLVFFGMFGMFFLLTQYLQVVHAYSAFQAGVRILPFAVGLMFVAPQSARLAERVGTKAVVAGGLVIVAIGLTLFSRLDIGSSYAYFVVCIVVLSCGMALTMPPSTASIMSSLPLRKAGVGSAINDTTRELGGALGVAVLGSLLAARYTHALHDSLTLLPSIAREASLASVAGAVGVAHRLGGPYGYALSLHARQAFVDGMGTALLVGAAVSLGAAVLVGWLLPVHLHYADEAHPMSQTAELEPVDDEPPPPRRPRPLVAARFQADGDGNGERRAGAQRRPRPLQADRTRAR